MVQPVVIEPFPDRQLKAALEGVTRLVAVEENATGQLAAILRLNGIAVDALVLHDNGRPMTADVLKARLGEAGL
jgi:2-oxoglutarate ferredoxin oxidoreductase subunit alpha